MDLASVPETLPFRAGRGDQRVATELGLPLRGDGAPGRPRFGTRWERAFFLLALSAYARFSVSREGANFSGKQLLARRTADDAPGGPGQALALPGPARRRFEIFCALSGLIRLGRGTSNV